MERSTLKWNWEYILLPKKKNTRIYKENWKIYFFFAVLGKREAFTDHWDRTVLVWTDISDKRYHCFHFRFCLFVSVFNMKKFICFFPMLLLSMIIFFNIFFFFGHSDDATMALTNEREMPSLIDNVRSLSDFSVFHWVVEKKKNEFEIWDSIEWSRSRVPCAMCVKNCEMKTVYEINRIMEFPIYYHGQLILASNGRWYDKWFFWLINMNANDK